MQVAHQGNSLPLDRYSFSQPLQTPSPRRLHFGNDDSKLISTTRIFAKKFLDTSPLPPKINTKSNAELANHTSENSQGTVKYNLRRHTEPFCDAAQAKCKVSQFDFYTTSPQFSVAARLQVRTKGRIAKVFTHLEQESDSQTHLEGTNRED